MAGSEGSAHLARSTLINMSGLLIPIFVQLATVPAYITVIGVDRYGVMALVWLLLGYFGFFDLGFGTAIARRLASLGTSQQTRREAVFWTGSVVSVLAGLAGGVGLYLLAERLFGHVLAVPHSLSAETQSCLPLLIVALPVITGISALSGALQGCEKFGAMNLAQVTGNILYQVFPLAVGALVSPSLPSLVTAAIAGRLFTLVLLFIFCVRQIPAGLIPRFQLVEVRPLLQFGSWVALTGVISPLLTVFDRFVIGTITGMTAVTAYTIPFNLVMRFSALPTALQGALFPRFAMTDAADAHALQVKSVRIMASLITPILVVGMFVVRPFLFYWIGPALAAQAAPVGDVLILGLWPNTMAFIPYGFLQSRGRPDLPAKFHVGELFFYAPALYFLTRAFGVVGAAWAFDARTLVDAGLLFAAVRLLDGFAENFVGAVLLVAAFAWAYFCNDSMLYWPGVVALALVSSVWACINMPADVSAKLRIRFGGWRKSPAL